MKYIERAKDDLRNDVTWNRAARLTVDGAKAIPGATGLYFYEKVPIVGWLPKYNPRWAINDVIAGLTLGLMLIPQALAYARIADIPVEYGLMSSWLPASLYAFMGTTKDLSTGPTSLIGLLTSENVHALQDRWTPAEIASATAFMMGIYGMILGFLKLGFLLEFISLPVLNGFITAIAITIILNQLDSLLGQEGIGDGTANKIHDTFAKLPEANGWDCLIGFSAILFLTILEKSGARWGKKNKIVWLLGITRAFLTLVLFTGISYAVNGGRAEEDHLFSVVKVQADGQLPPEMPRGDLIPEVAGRSIAVFLGAAIEHCAIARAFATKNGYTTDQTQELVYFGLTNFANSFFHAMGVGGAMSRTAVNSNCNVKSPLSGFVTTAVVLICVFFLIDVLYWIPQACLAAIIITAVWNLISPPSLFYKYWKTSLPDFIASMLVLWVALFVNTEIGIGVAVGFSILYYLLSTVFTRLTTTGSVDTQQSELPTNIMESRALPPHIPRDARVFRFNESLYFPNAFDNTTRVFDIITTFHAPSYNGNRGPETERNWSVVGEQRVARLRRKAGITDPDGLPPISVVVLDFGRVNTLDSTAVTHMRTMVAEIRKYGGKEVQIRFVGMLPKVRERFERAGWPIVSASPSGSDSEDADPGQATMEFPDVASALRAPVRRDSVVSENTMKATVTHEEKAAHEEKTAHEEEKPKADA